MLIFSNMGRGAVQGLITAAVFLIAMGLLLIAFPEFFAYIAAVILFLIAAFCLQSAWRVHKMMKQADEQLGRVEVMGRDDEDVIDV